MRQRLFRDHPFYPFLLVLASAGLQALALIYVSAFLGWLALAPLFLAMLKYPTGKQAFRLGLVFGFFSSLLLNFWVVKVVQHYAQGSMWLGTACLLATMAVMALVYGSQFSLFACLRFPASVRSHNWLNALLMTCLWVLTEWIRMQVFPGFPSLHFAVGLTQASQLYLVQPAAWGGVYLLSFLIVGGNYFLALALYRQQGKWITLALLMCGLHLAGGYWTYRHISSQTASPRQASIRTALVLAALPPEAVWDAHQGPGLVQGLLNLHQQAVKLKPNLVLWSETVVPWTYAADDDFLLALAGQGKGQGMHMLLGMNTAAAGAGGRLHNSAYLLAPGGTLTGRYDKQQLLSGVEQSLGTESAGLLLPFLARTGLVMHPGPQASPLLTPWGKAGVLICNESVVPDLTSAHASNGMSFLLNLSNNAWFYDSFVPLLHFYNARLRAVEARKDLVINSNLGISGLIRADGRIAARFQDARAGVQQVQVQPNDLPAFGSQWFIYLLLAGTGLLGLARLIRPRTAANLARPAAHYLE
ncbi:MAG: apolipoprotein N-acyltransferase [Adhaeribacter sp.]